MTEEQTESSSNIVHPNRALPKKYREPVLFLADRMSESDGKVVPKERKLVDELAKAAGYKDFRHEKWYMDFTVEKACQAINIDSARMGLLVVLALLLKADSARQETEHAFFTRVRQLVGGDPVTVPKDLDSHRKLALEYISG